MQWKKGGENVGSCSHCLHGVVMTVVRFCIFNLLLQFIELSNGMMWQAIVRDVDCKLEVYANANYSKMIPNVTNLTHSWYSFWD